MKGKTVGWILLGGGVLAACLLFRREIADGVENWEKTLFLNRLSPYNQLVEYRAAQEDINLYLFQALIWTESSGFPDVRTWEGPGIGYSYGFTGLTLEAARDMGFTGVEKDLLDPQVNLEFGAKYLAMWLDKSDGNVKLALSSYNGGYAAYYYYLQVGKFVNPSYISKVMGYYDLLRK